MNRRVLEQLRERCDLQESHVAISTKTLALLLDALLAEEAPVVDGGSDGLHGITGTVAPPSWYVRGHAPPGWVEPATTTAYLASATRSWRRWQGFEDRTVWERDPPENWSA